LRCAPQTTSWYAAKSIFELAPRYWRITRARIDRAELDREIGWLTIPELPLRIRPGEGAWRLARA
jgi:hypothetical protein